MSKFDELDDLSIFDMFRMEAQEQGEQMQIRLLALQSGAADEPTLRALMRGAHSLKGAARIVGLDSAVRLTHAMEERFVAAQGGTLLSALEVGVMLRAVDVLSALAEVREEEASTWVSEHEEPVKRLIDEIISPMDGNSPANQAAKQNDETSVTPVEIGPAVLAEPSQAPAKSPSDLNLRITSERFDRIIAMASDNLVQLQSVIRLYEQMRKMETRLGGLLRVLGIERTGNENTELAGAMEAAARESAERSSLLADLDRVIYMHEQNAEHLHREVLRARLRPFHDVLPGLRRLVRDLASEMGKQVRLDVTGERTEVDRDILERLRAPLEHLLRNALDHGAERPEERKAQGKAEECTITLSAQHENGRLVIRIGDDGRGVDVDAVRAQAIRRGLVSATVANSLSENEVLEFLFLPGFSTREAVTQISGRGFGLDVVQTMVHESGGSVRIQSVPSKGTTFVMTLSVTRSLMRVMCVEIEDELYAVPLMRISRLAMLNVRQEEDGSMTVPAGSGEGFRVAVISLADALHSTKTPLPSGQAMVMFFLDERGQEAAVAFQIDRVVEERTVAVRALDARLGKRAAIAAVTLTHNDVPMLILQPDDVLRIALQAREQPAARRSSEDGRGRILVVDDSPTVRQMLRRTLGRARYWVAVAEHGAEAWNLLQVTPFDLLVSDVDMPEMNGIELVERVRGNARLSHMPVILLSYKGREQDHQRGLKAGADAYVTKGEFDETTFLQTVIDLIGPPEIEGATP